ncbi:hypothetical protein PUNSTDRAFT_55401 [Punctularia strigosozonata HHB-11173 SS5]|nr:uncharacterized protein PUNSTDRAFT_55401 [Punctularia strigosozonata HHB-11173 SS5]EIN04679.1 hypothetical protein PUNSTDRAFT_55401 [Punctularia strigosozonata HHB-11173 SS5]
MPARWGGFPALAQCRSYLVVVISADAPADLGGVEEALRQARRGLPQSTIDHYVVSSWLMLYFLGYLCPIGRSRRSCSHEDL